MSKSPRWMIMTFLQLAILFGFLHVCSKQAAHNNWSIIDSIYTAGGFILLIVILTSSFFVSRWVFKTLGIDILIRLKSKNINIPNSLLDFLFIATLLISIIIFFLPTALPSLDLEQNHRIFILLGVIILGFCYAIRSIK